MWNFSSTQCKAFARAECPLQQASSGASCQLMPCSPRALLKYVPLLGLALCEISKGPYSYMAPTSSPKIVKKCFNHRPKC